MAAATIAVVFTIAARFTVAPAAIEERTLRLYNIHNKERIEVTFKRNGEYIPSAMLMINYFMRDWRRNEPIKMDPALIDLVWELHTELGSQEPIHLISGYRSKKTNNMLRRTRGGQGRKSQHLLGKAADIHFPDVSVKQLRNSALVREIGGVGYYPTSSIPFVHVDTGRVRHWPRVPRLELAALFPSGQSKHRPRGGKPITKRDYQLAMAKLAPTAPDPSPLREKKRQMMLASLAPEAAPSPFATKGQAPAPTAGSPVASMPVANATVASAPAPQPAARPEKPAVHLASLTDSLGDLVVRMTQASNLADGQSTEPPIEDPDHPDWLSYEPVSALPIVAASAGGTTVQPNQLVHPDQDEAGFLLLETEPRLAMSFERGGDEKPAGAGAAFRGRGGQANLRRQAQGSDGRCRRPAANPSGAPLARSILRSFPSDVGVSVLRRAASLRNGRAVPGSLRPGAWPSIRHRACRRRFLEKHPW